MQNNSEVVIAYYSKSLNIHEQQYCITRKELLAVVHAFKAFHHYLYGQSVLLRTDNAAVSWMRNLKQPTGQVARWLETLGTYNFTVIHRAGLQHRNADALSRAPCTKCARQQELNEVATGDESFTVTASATTQSDHIHNTEANEAAYTARVVTRSQVDPLSVFKQSVPVIPNWSLDEIRALQRTDTCLGPIIRLMEESSTQPSWQQVVGGSLSSKTLWRMWDRLSLHDGCLFRTWHDDNNHSYLQLVVPKQSQHDVLHYMHDIPSSAHPGSDKMLTKIQQTFHWPGLKADVERYCANCHKCSARKAPKLHKSPMGHVPTTNQFERCAVDIFGPLPRSNNGNSFVLVICDCFTRYTEAIAHPNQQAETIAKAL